MSKLGCKFTLTQGVNRLLCGVHKCFSIRQGESYYTMDRGRLRYIRVGNDKLYAEKDDNDINIKNELKADDGSDRVLYISVG